MASWWTAGGAGGAAGTSRKQAKAEEEETHYEVLGVRADADAASIRAAYQREVLRCHPDKQAAASSSTKEDDDRVEEERRRRFAAVQAAYNTLRDPTARAEYDAQLARRAQMEAASQITPAEELDLSEMDVEEEEEEEEAGGEGEGDDDGGGGGPAAADAGAAAANTATQQRRREEVATYPCRCGDLYRLPMCAVRAATKATAATASLTPPPLLVQCRGCSNHALVRLSRDG
jgi:curved DNA-binding protein CbpA